SSDAGLTSVISQTDGSPAGGDGATTGNAITWAVSVANAENELALSDIVVATDATAKLYSDSAFTANEDVTIALAVGATTGYIKVTAEDATIKYYAVTVTRAAP
ncbi:hypothetical protein HNV12_10960, partial [Methanococcoides sp. SA1]|nr:hypothetical protein [Methanococcoides sp. SA1]